MGIDLLFTGTGPSLFAVSGTAELFSDGGGGCVCVGGGGGVEY